MSWVAPEEITAIYPNLATEDADYIQALIDHAQGLAEVIVGTQATPGVGLQSTLKEIVLRFWRGNKAAEGNPAGFQSESVEDYSYSVPTGGAHFSQATGLGLTKHEKKNLRSAVGRSGLWMLPTTRGNVETAPSDADTDAWVEGGLAHLQP
jgi:hypothetical protein